MFQSANTTLPQQSSFSTARAGTGPATLSPITVERAMRRGRRIRALALKQAVGGIGTWLLNVTRGAMLRRADVRLGCSECGAMTRA